MNHYIYDEYQCVALTDKNDMYTVVISSFDEYTDEIIVETNFPIEYIKRGWIGDLAYYLSKDKANKCAGFRDVLLARVTVSSNAGCDPFWKYTFLKN